VAYLQAVDGVSIDTGEMRKALKSQLPDVMVPSVYAVLETFPLTPNGKVDRNALPDPEPVKRPTAAYEAPAGNVEQTISNVWRSVLNMDQISASDNFFDLGGHSLLAAQVVRQLSERLGQDVPVVSLFQYPTIRALAEHLGGAVEEADSGASRGQSRAEMRRQRMMRR
jgi:acyl carrier protein